MAEVYGSVKEYEEAIKNKGKATNSRKSTTSTPKPKETSTGS